MKNISKILLITSLLITGTMFFNLKEVNAQSCLVPVCFTEEDPTILISDICFARSTISAYVDGGIAFLKDTVFAPTNFDTHIEFNPIYDIYPFSSNPQYSFWHRIVNNPLYHSIWLDSNCDGVKNAFSRDSELSFSYNVPLTSDEVTVGIMGDNYWRIYLNGERIHGGRSIGPGESRAFTTMSFHPIDTNNCGSILTFKGIGDGTVNDALGVIVFDNTLQEVKDATQISDLTVLFSSSELISTTPTSHIAECNTGFTYHSIINKCIQEIICPIICGDSFHDASEQCDDGNLIDGDGCSSICEIESTKKSSEKKKGSVKFGCKDKDAINYSRFVSHKQSLCKYTKKEIKKEIEDRCNYFKQWSKIGDMDGLSSKYIQESGKKETTYEVSKLQNWLNKSFNFNLKVDGIFGKETKKGVEDYQMKFKNYILDAWSPSWGNHKTGNFKNTSKWTANYLMGCKDAPIHYDGDQTGLYLIDDEEMFGRFESFVY